MKSKTIHPNNKYNIFGFHSILFSLLLRTGSFLFYIYREKYLFIMLKSISYFNINDHIVLSIPISKDSQMWIITNKYQSIRTIPLGHYQIPLLIYSKQPVPNHYLSFPISILFKPSFGYYWWIGIIIICEYLI